MQIDRRLDVALRLEGEEDVAVSTAIIQPFRERLIEHIEESRAELQNLGLFDLEVLKEAQIPVLPIRRAEIQW